MAGLSAFAQDPKYLQQIRDRGPVYTHKLEWPILGGEGAMIDEISFQEPTAGDLYTVGNPVTRVDYSVNPWRIERDQAVYFDMMMALSNVPAVNLFRMAPTDVLMIEYALDHFFCPGVKTRPSSGEKENSSEQQEQPAL